ncbi:MAG: adenosylmethionine decarboxylase [Planctomycetales bacterium]|nr:adenosylmethionine decarboxylase [Planctomycetales bacterium]
MHCNSTEEQGRLITIPKETSYYRIVTDDPSNWHIVANRPVAQGKLVLPAGIAFHIDVAGVEFVDVVLQETQERKRVYTVVSAVPSDASCVQNALEIPWCFMNHSCTPNTVDRWDAQATADLEHAETEAIRDIAEGEELTFDYDLEQHDYGSPFECRCGAESCRRVIRGFGGLVHEQQERLLAIASPFVQHKYRRESVNMQPHGRHLVIDYWDCDASVLNDEARLSQLLTKAANAAGATVISTHSHRFAHQGITAVAILSESHLSIHTWPETRYAGVDAYTCGECDPLLAHRVLVKELSAGRAEFVELSRGRANTPRSIAVSEESPQRSRAEDGGDWFFEGAVPGRRHGNINHGFRISNIVLKERTRFQECLIFDSPIYGRVLVLDGIVQLSTLDEHVYHEMLVHPPMLGHPRPRRVVIVGGGDGGALREVLRHNPEQVVMIDIDEQFVRAAAIHLPSLNDGAFTDARVALIFEDASEALLRYENAFDVAIIDCNDAIGPSKILFEDGFYAAVARSLKEDGICSVQAGSILDIDFLQQTRDRIATHMGRTASFRLTMPSYHCGEYVFFVASRSLDPSGPDTATLNELQAKRGIATRYWSPAIHHASQVFAHQFELR